MDYNLHQSNLIKNNHQTFINECSFAYKLIKDDLNIKDPTWKYTDYNIFAVTSSSILFYNLYRELNYHIRSYVGNDQPLWIQAWLNYHTNDEILSDKLGESQGFHSHEVSFHGYVSIEPQNTLTKFRNGLEIKNKIGQIYIGPALDHNKGKNGEYDHYVTPLTPSTSPRITLGFNINNEINSILYHSYIPLL